MDVVSTPAWEAAWQLWPVLALFTAVLLFFHSTEFLLAAVFMREGLSCKSFLISRPYAIAMLGALTEFAVEAVLVPTWKHQLQISAAGILLVLLGEVLRKSAMLTAGGNFTHVIRHQQDTRHNLVTHGVYRFFRHPGYLGWYCWVIGTQLLLVNPVSLVAFAYVVIRYTAAPITRDCSSFQDCDISQDLESVQDPQGDGEQVGTTVPSTIQKELMCGEKGCKLSRTTSARIIMAWRFFKERIEYEERLLLRFFGQRYADYAKRTPTWLPGIPGTS